MNKEMLHYKVLNESIINDSLKYHIENNLLITENVYRYGSMEFFNFINTIRELYQNKDIELSSLNEDIINTDIGKKDIYENQEVWLDIIYEAVYKGKEVELDKPKRGGTKKFYVYTKNDKGKVIKVSFGAKDGGGKLAVKINNPTARNNFAKRHDCENKNDKTKPSYWSCRLPRYAKNLNLSNVSAKWW